MDKIAIILTTINRDKLLLETLESVIDVWQENWKVYIVDQNEEDSEEKQLWYKLIANEAHKEKDKKIEVLRVPYDCGISYARNAGVKKAHEDGFKYVILGADSIKFTKKMERVNDLLHYMRRYDVIGLDINNRIKWEAKLNLIKDSHFELDFIDTSCKTCSSSKIVIYNCDIVRNFFLAKTESLVNSPWDEDLKMREHESAFYEFKQKGYKVGWTKWCIGEYIGEKTKKDGSEYSKLRQKNWRDSMEVLKKKYNLKKWVSYKNLDNVHKK